MNVKLYQKFLLGQLDEEGLMRALQQLHEKSRARYAEEADKYNPYFTLDNKIYIHKYYPWCYEEYRPKLVLQGWYNPEIAKKVYKKVYGPKALKYVKFIRGKDAIEKGFNITHHLYINNRWRYIVGKQSMFHCSGTGLGLSDKRLWVNNSKGTTGYQKRKNLEKDIIYINNGSKGESIFKDTSIKKVRLQATKAAENRRKKDLYEE